MSNPIRPNQRQPVTARALALRCALTTLGVLAATQIVPGLHFDSWAGLITAALVLGLLNAFLRPLLLLLSLPLVVVSLGLFLWIINASLLYFVGWLVKSFHVDSFPAALGGAAVISLVSLIGSPLLGLGSGPTLRFRTTLNKPNRPAPPRNDPHRGPGPGPDGGPVIDV